MGGRISEASLREIRDRADIVEVVSETVSLARKGQNLWGLCPFHGEKTPSFSVHPGRQAFKCFGCGEGGGSIAFVMKARNLSFSEAAEDLAARYGIEIQYEGGAPSKRGDADAYPVLAFAAEVYRDLLRGVASGHPARETVRRRGITPEAEQNFFLGYGGSGRDLLDALAKKGISQEVAERAGLLSRKDDGTIRERFGRRLLFPVSDVRGRICGFGGRAIGDQEPKYLNSPDSPAYRKGTLLYGLHLSSSAIRTEGMAVVVEGYMDLIGLWQKGIRCVVATCGTSLTEGHARILSRFEVPVVLFFDGDEAGKKSAVRAGPVFYGEGVSPRMLVPPEGKDPDDWAKEVDGAFLLDRLKGAEPLMDSIVNGLAHRHDLRSTSGRLSFVKATEVYLRWIPEPVERRLYAQKVGRLAGLPEETVIEQVWGRPGPTSQHGATKASVSLARPGAAAREEERVVTLLASDASLASTMVSDGSAALLTDPELAEVVRGLSEALSGDPTTTLSQLLSGEALSEGARRRAAAWLVSEERSPSVARRAYDDAVILLRTGRKTRELRSLAEEMGRAKADGDNVRAEALLAEQMKIRTELDRLERERRSAG